MTRNRRTTYIPTGRTPWQNTLTALAAVLTRIANKEGATRS